MSFIIFIRFSPQVVNTSSMGEWGDLSINISSKTQNDSFISKDLIELLTGEGSTPLSVTKDSSVGGRVCPETPAICNL